MPGVHIVVGEAVVARSAAGGGAEVALGISAGDLGAGSLVGVQLVTELAGKAGGSSVAEVAVGHGRTVDLRAGGPVVQGLISRIAVGAGQSRVVQ